MSPILSYQCLRRAPFFKSSFLNFFLTEFTFCCLVILFTCKLHFLKCYKVGHAEWEGGLNVSGSVNSVRLLIHIPGCMRLDMRQNSDGHSTDTVPDM
jgi:hypothetical protein